ncbi:hypothetical protein JOD64_001444 [Micromonospora luteifusca]|uniref:Uncharacterized protein n=1 Tax=Micromonospora luteifusca TaxID=709860 RepID=A0ABS2LQK3_9ACTN|nr:hypothetical protein [Micromonospora luteifusca]MBM7490222.1 hypothetical protein [Micromonospora luteifusca]
MRKAFSVVGAAIGLIIALYFIVRAVIEPFVIDFSDPASYQNDWGAPSLAAVLAVHCGPGVLAAVIIIVVIVRRARAKADKLR